MKSNEIADAEERLTALLRHHDLEEEERPSKATGISEMCPTPKRTT